MKNLQRKKNHQKKRLTTNKSDVARPFVEHPYELRRHLIYIVSSIIIFSALAYFVQQYLVSFLLNPSKGQQFIYTSPGVGISFLFGFFGYFIGLLIAFHFLRDQFTNRQIHRSDYATKLLEKDHEIQVVRFHHPVLGLTIRIDQSARSTSHSL